MHFAAGYRLHPWYAGIWRGGKQDILARTLGVAVHAFVIGQKLIHLQHIRTNRFR